MPSNYIYTNDGLISTDELAHYGVLGMKWGHRKSIVSTQKTPYEKKTEEYAKRRGINSTQNGSHAKKTEEYAKRRGINSEVPTGIAKTVSKVKKSKNTGKKRSNQIIAKHGNKSVKALGKSVKLGLSAVQSLYNISDTGREQRQYQNQINMYGGMSPGYKRRFVYN